MINVDVSLSVVISVGTAAVVSLDVEKGLVDVSTVDVDVVVSNVDVGSGEVVVRISVVVVSREVDSFGVVRIKPLKSHI